MLYKTFNPADIDKYFRMMATMKTQLDSHYNGKSKQPKDLAVLFKRYVLQTTDIINNVSSQYKNSHERQILFLQTQKNDAESTYQKLVAQIKMHGPTGEPSIISQGYPSMQSFQSTYSSSFATKSDSNGYPSLTSGNQMISLQSKQTGTQSTSYPSLNGQQNINNSGYGTLAYPSLDMQKTSFTSNSQQSLASQPGLSAQYSATNFYQTTTQSTYQQFDKPPQYQQSSFNGYSQQSYQMPQVYSPDTQPFLQKQTSASSSNLRKVLCPLEIIDSFIRLSQANTQSKLETCAILAGNEKSGELVIDTLIIPKQEGHQDHCFMTDEIELFEAQINHKVMTIGWIHTHPQYSLFLSSVDLHNQLGYQQQMPEAVAIVYSPIEKELYKAFRVKENRIGEILKCSKTGFHEHKDEFGQFAWEQCSHIEYVYGSQRGISVKTIDFRMK